MCPDSYCIVSRRFCPCRYTSRFAHFNTCKATNGEKTSLGEKQAICNIVLMKDKTSVGRKTNSELSMIMSHETGDYRSTTSNYKLAPILITLLHKKVLSQNVYLCQTAHTQFAFLQEGCLLYIPMLDKWRSRYVKCWQDDSCIRTSPVCRIAHVHLKWPVYVFRGMVSWTISWSDCYSINTKW